MMTKKYKAELEIEAVEQARQRRMESVQDQQVHISNRKSSGFIKITRRITDSEKRLISFITKSLGVQFFLHTFSDCIIL